MEKCVFTLEESRLSPYLRGETKMQKSVGVRRCRLVPVGRAETSMVKNVEICVCVCRLVPILTYNVNNNATENVKSVHFTPVFRGEMTCSIRVCVCVCSSRALFKGRNANCTQRGPPEITILGHTPTRSHKMMYFRRPSSACATKSVARAKREERTLWKKPPGRYQNLQFPANPARNVRFSR